MEKSVSPFDVMSVEPYIRVEPLVFDVLGYFGIDVNEAASHFVEVVDKMRACPPNYRFKKTEKNNVWIVRDYFPGTSFMFKVTMVYQTAQQRADYENKTTYNGIKDNVCKASDFADSLWVNVKFINSKLRYSSRIFVPYQDGQKYALAKTANILIGDEIKPEPFIKKDIKKLKRMFPKGYKAEAMPEKRPTQFTSWEDKKRKRR